MHIAAIIVLLFSAFSCFAQKSARHIMQQQGFTPGPLVYIPLTTFNTTANQTSYTTSSVQPEANCLLLACVHNSGVAVLNVPTCSGMSLTWTLIKQTNFNNGANMVSMFYTTTGPSPAAGTVTIDYAGQTQNGAAIEIVEVLNAKISAPIVQSAVATNATANPSITLSALANANNGTLGWFGNVTNPFGATPGTGFTQDINVGYISPTTGTYSEYAIPGNITVTCTKAAAQWGEIAIEIARSP